MEGRREEEEIRASVARKKERKKGGEEIEGGEEEIITSEAERKDKEAIKTSVREEERNAFVWAYGRKRKRELNLCGKNEGKGERRRGNRRRKTTK